ncbi:MAG TPA: phage tail protein [Tepidiformaceae bacterium]|nr:phage tail protein [Tepidiformaceae bacterium]
MSEKSEHEVRHGVSRRSLLGGAAVGAAGLAAGMVEVSPVSAAVAPRGGPRRPLAIEKEPGVALTFLLTVPSIGKVGPFSELEIPGPETSIIEYRDGSDPEHTQYLPGPTKYSTVRLGRAFVDSLELASWRAMVETGAGSGVIRDCTLDVHGPDGSAVARYNLINAWPSKLEIGALKAGSSDVLMETVTLVCEHIQRVSV